MQYIFRMMKSKLKKNLSEIHKRLLAAYGPQECCLVHRNPFELLVATILSAQCTDKMVNSVTPGLFEVCPTAEKMASLPQDELEKLIHSCGFYRAKAKNIRAASQAIVEKFHGEVPDNMEELTSLPGVGRKTANVVLGDAFHVPGLPVDTHVKRLMNLAGTVKTEDPEEIEDILCGALPPELWAEFSHLVIIHGRTRCPARRPDCKNCEICDLCKHGIEVCK